MSFAIADLIDDSTIQTRSLVLKYGPDLVNHSNQQSREGISFHATAPNSVTVRFCTSVALLVVKIGLLCDDSVEAA